MANEISLKITKKIEVLNSDLVIVAKQNGRLLGTLTISKGTVDWRPKDRKAGKKGETQLGWAEFARIMEENNKN